MKCLCMHLQENPTFFHNPSSSMRTLRALKKLLNTTSNWTQEIDQGFHITPTFLFQSFFQDAFYPWGNTKVWNRSVDFLQLCEVSIFDRDISWFLPKSTLFLQRRLALKIRDIVCTVYFRFDRIPLSLWDVSEDPWILKAGLPKAFGIVRLE